MKSSVVYLLLRKMQTSNELMFVFHSRYYLQNKIDTIGQVLSIQSHKTDCQIWSKIHRV